MAVSHSRVNSSEAAKIGNDEKPGSNPGHCSYVAHANLSTRTSRKSIFLLKCYSESFVYNKYRRRMDNKMS